MRYFMAFTVLSFALSVVTVQGGDIGAVHAEGRSASTVAKNEANEVKRELKDLLKGKSNTDVMELRKELVKKHKKEHESHHNPKCPFGFGSQRPDGCCASKSADDLREAKSQCVTSTAENGKAKWEVFEGGANSKFTCCPKKETVAEKLKGDIAELEQLVAQKEKKKKQGQDVDWKKEEDTTEAEMQNQLGLDRKKMHNQAKHNHDNEKDARERKAAKAREDEARRKRKEREAAKQRERHADNEHLARQEHEEMMRQMQHLEESANEDRSAYSWAGSMLWVIELIPVLGIVAFAIYFLATSDVQNIQIPGHPPIDLTKVVRDAYFALFPGERKWPVTTYVFDKLSGRSSQINFGSYGGYGGACGCDDGTHLVFERDEGPVRNDYPVYQSERLARGGTAEQADSLAVNLTEAFPRTSFRSYQASPDEDVGL